MKENQSVEKKRLDIVIGKTANWKEIAKDCICFANSCGGLILIGIGDNDHLPPATQIIETNLPFRIKKKIAENSVNVGIKIEIKTADNGGEYIEVEVLFSSSTIAATTNGKYYYRSDDTCVPLMPDELSRLFTDKPSFIWETRKTKVLAADIDIKKLQNFQEDIQKSSRVSTHVKQMSTEELLDHYFFVDGEYLTNLGILWVVKEMTAQNFCIRPPYTLLNLMREAKK